MWHGNSRPRVRAPPSVHIPLGVGGVGHSAQGMPVCLSTVHWTTQGATHKCSPSPRRAVERARRSGLFTRIGKRQSLLHAEWGSVLFVMLTPACTPGSGNTGHSQFPAFQLNKIRSAHAWILHLLHLSYSSLPHGPCWGMEV